MNVNKSCGHSNSLASTVQDKIRWHLLQAMAARIQDNVELNALLRKGLQAFSRFTEENGPTFTVHLGC